MIKTISVQVLSTLVIAAASVPSVAKTTAASSAAAAPAVRVGEASLSLPILRGFQAVPIEKTADIAQKIGSANRLLAYHSADGGDPEQARENAAKGRTFLVQTARAYESKTMTQEEFNAAKADLRKAFAALQPEKDGAKAASKGLPVLQRDRPTGLQLFAGSENSLAVLVGARREAVVEGQKREVSQLIASAMVLLRGKMVTLSVYSVLNTPADIEWVEKQTRTWIKEAVAANK